MRTLTAWHAQLEHALYFLAKQWETSPGSSEDLETCLIHAATLRYLVDATDRLRIIGRANLSESQFQELIDLAQQAGLKAGRLEICSGCGQRFSVQEIKRDLQGLYYCGDCEALGQW